MLTIADVTDKKFTTTRLREGYEIAEVDQFVAEVHSSLTLRDREITELREQLAVARAKARSAEPKNDGEPGKDPGSTDGDSIRESATAAARLLELATVNAEQLVDEAKSEAGSLVAAANAEAEMLTATSRVNAEELTSKARTEAAKVTTDARALAAKVTSEARNEAERVNTELDKHRNTVLSEVADRKAALEAKISELASLESEHRGRMRSYFSAQLARLQDDVPVSVQSDTESDNEPDAPVRAAG